MGTYALPADEWDDTVVTVETPAGEVRLGQPVSMADPETLTEVLVWDDARLPSTDPEAPVAPTLKRYIPATEVAEAVVEPATFENLAPNGPPETAVSLSDWSQPTGAHDSYPEGAVVSHGGKIWASTTPANVWEPGVSGWRDTPEGGGPGEWVQPTGAHDAYQTGDEVMFEGTHYRSLIDANIWSPTSYPAGWETV